MALSSSYMESSKSTSAVDPIVDYYKRRAAYYERGHHKPERQEDLRAMEAWVKRPFAGRQVLELACGTGWWTPHGAHQAESWLATDLNPETMDLARQKEMPSGVRFAKVDAYTLEGLDRSASNDAVFAGCWWSHVPLTRLAPWLALVHARLGMEMGPKQSLRTPARRRVHYSSLTPASFTTLPHRSISSSM